MTTTPAAALRAEVRAGLRLTDYDARTLRVRAGLSCGSLAEMLGVHRSTLSRWERRLTVPRAAQLDMYLEMLDVLRAELGE